MHKMILLAVSALLAAVCAPVNAEEIEIDGLKAPLPQGWVKETPKNSMRAYQFKIPKVEGDSEDAEMIVFFFKGGSGTVEANLKRQVAKFEPAEGKDKIDEAVSKVTIGKAEATYQDLAGTYLSRPSPGDPNVTKKPNFRQLYVVYTGNSGEFYFTLVGPAKTIEKNKAAFDTFLKSLK